MKNRSFFVDLREEGMGLKDGSSFGFEQGLLSKRLDCQQTQLMTLGSKQ